MTLVMVVWGLRVAGSTRCCHWWKLAKFLQRGVMPSRKLVSVFREYYQMHFYWDDLWRNPLLFDQILTATCNFMALGSQYFYSILCSTGDVFMLVLAKSRLLMYFESHFQWKPWHWILLNKLWQVQYVYAVSQASATLFCLRSCVFSHVLTILRWAV